jgi:hypothetical protein
VVSNRRARGERVRRSALSICLPTLLAASPLSAQPAGRSLSEQEMIDMMVGSSIQASRSSDSASMIKRGRPR